MPYPTRSQILAILCPLFNPPAGDKEFFAHVRDDVNWIFTGHMMLSGTWKTKDSYPTATFAKIGPLFAEPGMKLEVPGGEEGIVVGEDGRAVVELKTVDTYTRSGALYDQHYSWHIWFDEDSMVMECSWTQRTWRRSLAMNWESRRNNEYIPGSNALTLFPSSFSV